MLYPTHKKYGILWGLVFIPIAVAIGLIPTITSEMRNSDLFISVMTVCIGMIGALFGSRFPDIDSPTSIPSKRHPIIAKIFRLTGVTHRGKFSHDVASIGVFFGIIYLIVQRGGTKYIHFVSNSDSNIIYTVSYLTILIIVYLIGTEIVSELQDFANKIKSKKMWAILEKHKYIFALTAVGWLLLILVLSGMFNIKELVTGTVGLDSAIWSAIVTVVLLKVFVVFSLAGAYSHLFADMTTKSGISIFGIKLAPAQVVLKLKKLPIIGKHLMKTEFKTGSKWEDMNNKIVTILIIPFAILALLVLFGFDIKELFKIIGIL